MAPATPTGLMVSETTETSITWTWNASEGATGYVVQANMDEMWDATDTVLFDGASVHDRNHLHRHGSCAGDRSVCPGRRRCGKPLRRRW